MFNETKYKDDYMKKNYDRVELRFKKGTKEKLKELAALQDKPLRTFLMDIIEKETGVK